MKTPRTVCVIGAGVAGLTCARVLQRAGVEVTVFEKSRGLGGRVATRRTDSGVTFDHGAQYFTVRDPAFAQEVQSWYQAGVAGIWPGKIVSLDRGTISMLTERVERYVGIPAMNSIAKTLASGLSVQTNLTVKSIHREAAQWRLMDAAGETHGLFDCLISSAPAFQTRALFSDHSVVIDQALSRVVMNPCWAVMVEFKDVLQTSFDAAFVQNSPLSWVARNSSKPSRDAAECWVLHGSAAWSVMHLEDSATDVMQALLNEFWLATSQPPQEINAIAAHRWRYAIPQEPLPQRFLYDPEINLGACGDWCGGPRVEGAYLSGLEIAAALLS